MHVNICRGFQSCWDYYWAVVKLWWAQIHSIVDTIGGKRKAKTSYMKSKEHHQPIKYLLHHFSTSNMTSKTMVHNYQPVNAINVNNNRHHPHDTLRKAALLWSIIDHHSYWRDLHYLNHRNRTCHDICLQNQHFLMRWPHNKRGHMIGNHMPLLIACVKYLKIKKRQHCLANSTLECLHICAVLLPSKLMQAWDKKAIVVCSATWSMSSKDLSTANALPEKMRLSKVYRSLKKLERNSITWKLLDKFSIWIGGLAIVVEVSMHCKQKE